MQNSLKSEPRRQQILSHRTLERLTAALLLLYCVAQVVTIVTRIASGSDQPDALSAMSMISVNHPWYLASKIANLVAAFCLLGAGVFIYRIFRVHDRALSLLASALLVTAALFWLYSSLAGLALAELLSEGGGPTAEYRSDDLSSQTTLYAFHAIEPVRAVAGRVGFTAVALGLGCYGARYSLFSRNH